MKPTTEQVRQWVREATKAINADEEVLYTKVYVEKLAALAYAAGVAAERKTIAEMVSQCDPRAKPKGIAAAIRALGDDDE